VWEKQSGWVGDASATKEGARGILFFWGGRGGGGVTYLPTYLFLIFFEMFMFYFDGVLKPLVQRNGQKTRLKNRRGEMTGGEFVFPRNLTSLVKSF
jgi:hypothetical protein